MEMRNILLADCHAIPRNMLQRLWIHPESLQLLIFLIINDLEIFWGCLFFQPDRAAGNVADTVKLLVKWLITAAMNWRAGFDDYPLKTVN